MCLYVCICLYVVMFVCVYVFVHMRVYVFICIYVFVRQPRAKVFKREASHQVLRRDGPVRHALPPLRHAGDGSTVLVAGPHRGRH